MPPRSHFGLGIYATVVSTAVGLLTLYGELFQRVKVHVSEDYRVNVRGRWLVFGQKPARDLGVPDESRKPILTVRVINRGLRPVTIRSVSKAYWAQTKRHLFEDMVGSIRIDPGEAHSFHLGDRETPYEHGSIGRLNRVYVLDAADRVHPVTQRWIQRIENVVWRRLTIWIGHRRDA
jgi:hypothetical protein